MNNKQRMELNQDCQDLCVEMSYLAQKYLQSWRELGLQVDRSTPSDVAKLLEIVKKLESNHAVKYMEVGK